MKLVIFFFTLLAVSAFEVAQAAKCSDHILSLKGDVSLDDEDGRSSSSYDPTSCSAMFSAFHKHLPDLHGLINEHISQSFLYSVMASHFEADFQNRLGFGKYLDELANSQWDDALSLIKYAGKRGAGIAPIETQATSTPGLKLMDLNTNVKTWTEVEALALALDHFHGVANKVHQLHADSHKDASLVDFLENQLVGKHVDRVRQLSGYLTNLVPMVGEPQGMDLALYLFDQSLA